MADVDIAELQKQYAELGEQLKTLGVTTDVKKKVPRVKLEKADDATDDDDDAADDAADDSADDAADDDAADESIAKKDDKKPVKKAKAKASDDDEDDDKWSEKFKSKKGMKKAADEDDEDDESFAFGGQTIQKSVIGPIQFGVMKSMSEQLTKSAGDIEKAKDDALTARLEKRADEEYPHVPGTTADRAEMLKAITKMAEPLRKKFEAVFAANEKLAKTAFGKIGVNGGDVDPSNDLAKAKVDFETKVAEIKKRDSVSRTDAMSKARSEHPALFKAYQDLQSAN